MSDEQDDLTRAPDRMCMPLDPSRLAGVTAKEDARCMQTIRDAVESLRTEVRRLTLDQAKRSLAAKDARSAQMQAGLDHLKEARATQDSERDRLVAENKALRQALADCDAVARKRGDRFGLCDQFDSTGKPYPTQRLANLMAAQQGGER